MSKRVAHSVLLLLLVAVALGLAGCPDPNEESPCGEDPCPRLTTCDSVLKRCAAPNEVSPERVTRGPSLAIAEDGAIYVAAYAGDSRDLVFGVWDTLDGAFRYQIVDHEGDVGRYAALSVFSDGRPAVAYFDATDSRLKFAHLREDDTWQVEVVDETSSVGTDVDLTVDDEDVAHVVYRDFTGNSLRYARRVEGIWRIRFVDTGADEFSGVPEQEVCPVEQRERVRRGVGFDAHIVVQGGAPVISYYDADCGALRLARGSGDTFSLRVVDGWNPDAWEGPTQTPPTSVGRFSDLAVDPLGQLMLAYFDASQGVLKVARSPAGVPTIEIADDGRREVDGEPFSKRIVGQSPSIAFDSQGVAIVTHLDAETRKVLVTTSANGNWATEPIGANLQGFETDLAITADDTRVIVGVNRALADMPPIGIAMRSP